MTCTFRFALKTFRGEHFLDNHMVFRHANETTEKGSHCLADLCPILHCEYFYPEQEDANHRQVPVNQCNALDMEYKRYKCESVAHECFPFGVGRESHESFDFFVHFFCSTLGCDLEYVHEILGSLKPSRHVTDNHAYAVVLAVCLVLYYTLVCAYQKIAGEHEHGD